ncbi:MAG: leucine--tRNA ligase [Patescibacteria group bacterium]|nr:leucine--tRNA ligase [Patescibacteria group bacterium]MDE2438315.1 leucine--tRNA ligase [Patescibacteria group bacterium]
MNYNHKLIEKKWQKKWEESKIYRADDTSSKPKYYALVEFPYPSGEGLHVGHIRPYTGLDVIARKRRMQGFNVLYPFGWDAFGLPTENYAIKTGIHPKIITKKNTDTFRRQLKSLGFSFDWDREVNTTDPTYYKWTQWIFLQLYKKGLAYKAKMAINWCPKDKIGLANEEVIGGACERCGTAVEKKEKEQWMLAITQYAQRLYDDLDSVDYIPAAKTGQRNWIGPSAGALVKFPVVGSEHCIEVFTTRIDTIFSGTYVVLAPEHPMIEDLKGSITNWDEVEQYCAEVRNISDIERTSFERPVSGIALRGIHVTNPATGEEMPVWVADFVLAHYGTGAVFADAHDARDFELAKKYNIPLKTSIVPDDKDLAPQVENLEVCFEGEGILIHSQRFDGMTSSEARPKIIEWLKEKGSAEPHTTYKLRDWVFSRQRYWGEPIPMIHCDACGWQPVSEDDLPLELPEVERYEPTDTGESPLASMTDWVNVSCPVCGGSAKRETDTMPNWAGSSWYFLRYVDPHNANSLADKEKLTHWMPVDWYNGGMEHTTLHLLYSRFWNKFLYDIGVSPVSEAYQKRTSHGIVLASGGEKMSKSRGNVVNPDTVVDIVGADALRIYEMFMGPFDQAIPWDERGLNGAHRFLGKVWDIAQKGSVGRGENESITRLLQKTIKKVTEDIESMSFNTAISALMIFTNECYKADIVPQEAWNSFLHILAPFAPHMSEELWHTQGHTTSVHRETWPQYDAARLEEELVSIVIQVNGKMRGSFETSRGSTKDANIETAKRAGHVSQYLEGKTIVRVVYVPDKLINFVIK